MANETHDALVALREILSRYPPTNLILELTPDDAHHRAMPMLPHATVADVLRWRAALAQPGAGESVEADHSCGYAPERYCDACEAGKPRPEPSAPAPRLQEPMSDEQLAAQMAFMTNTGQRELLAALRELQHLRAEAGAGRLTREQISALLPPAATFEQRSIAYRLGFLSAIDAVLVLYGPPAVAAGDQAQDYCSACHHLWANHGNIGCAHAGCSCNRANKEPR